MKSIFSSEMKSFLHLITEIRNKKGFTQNALSQLLKKPQSYVSKYESGERRLDIIEIKKICEAMEYDMITLIKNFLECENDPR